MPTPATEPPIPRLLIPAQDLELKIGELLDVFFTRRIHRLGELKLDGRIRSKNPYLFRAIGVAAASEIVEELLDAHISSSDETIFGNVFFEPLAKWVAEQAFASQLGVSVQVSHGAGSDIQISTPEENQAIAVKSGTKIFNQQSRAKQIDEFKKINHILKKEKKHFRAIVGYCYGRKEQRGVPDFTELAGQRFWEHLTGEQDFYIRIIRLMKLKPLEHRPKFIDQYNKAKTRFTKDFLEQYAVLDGSIDWEKLVTLISAAEAPKKPTTAKRPKLPRKATG